MNKKRFFSTVLLTLLLTSVSIAQQFDNLIIEKKNVDDDNKIYKKYKAFVFSYEIFDGTKACQLDTNKEPYHFVEFDKNRKESIHLLVPHMREAKRTNKRQTEIKYLYTSDLNRIHGTGVVENEENVWLHPPRYAFFSCLETCPFPYVKYPLQIGTKWQDAMKISDNWSHEKWGKWQKKLLLNYEYQITEKVQLNTPVGELECYVIESTAKSKIGTSRLKSYFSEKYGFVRMEYQMFTGLKLNLNLEKLETKHDLYEIKGVVQYMMDLKRISDK